MEQVLSSCCGFLHDMHPPSELAMIQRYMKLDDNGQLPAMEAMEGGYKVKRRAFLITSMPVEGSVQILPDRWALTYTPWDPAKVESHIADSRHVKSYNVFRYEHVLGKTALNIFGFDGTEEGLNRREESFLKLDLEESPELPRLCILSNAQHVAGEPFLLKHGYKPMIRGTNNYWHNNLLTVFTKDAPKRVA